MRSSDDLSGVATSVASFVAANDIGKSTAYALDLILEELVTNIAKHGSGTEGATISIALELADGIVHGTVKDNAAPFDPLKNPPPDTTARLDDRKIGGLGVHFVRTLVENVSYRCQAGENVLSFELRMKEE